jgi:pantoate--beta-alanine ligase
MKVLRTIADLRAERRQVTQCCKVGLVPTMGAFHAGHVSLFRAARAECDVVVVSLFVNPAQFGTNDDLARYPRDEDRDVRIAEEEHVDVVFAPTQDQMYPRGFDTWVDVASTGAEGAARPGHFRGVATVCVKLFNIVDPQVAYFGRKDAQQVAVLRRVIRDLDLDVDLHVLPTVRDVDGLALSSRNAYLSAEERAQALALPRALEAARTSADPVAAARRNLNGLVPDYVEIVDLDGERVLAAAVRVGSTRLIDNVALEGGDR